ncbi:hypothetical protein [Notoacmeibacter sp. MSK16QG-6]|uniref:hypothetical protein n=1 Tax=Notoacmeibacter sp. MSK16QG-6 TaxID=2957982 RepID=UPI00209CCDA7|nr:hypothetical protein [Notoacmeibacter sp. MSK16QG-6]MCP1200901.1 hypothetical protein [Notoacmeibacter sp. MSK16QG-6]
MKVLIPGFVAIFAGASIASFAALPPAAVDTAAEVESSGQPFEARNVAVPRREGEKTDGYIVADISGLHDDGLSASAATAYVTAALGLLASTHQVQDLDPDVVAHRGRLAKRIMAALDTMGQSEAIHSIEVTDIGFIARAKD